MSISQASSLRLRGSSLLITMIIAAGFAVLAIAAVDRMVGMRQVRSVDLAKQRSAAAAEAVAAMIESRLMDAAADYTKLVTAVDDPAHAGNSPWWNLNGCVYRDSTGTMRGPGYDADAEPLWLNGCLVRWIVEPVRLYNQSWSATPSGEFVVNPPRDPTQELAWKDAAKLGPDGTAVPGTQDTRVGDFYHFRVVVQAYAMRDGEMDLTAEPWSTPGTHVAASQSLRVLQIQSLQLFKYALFYGADTPIGDLDLQTGATIWVQKGAVHSNGAIYIRGGESAGFYAQNWHRMASGDGNVDSAMDFPGQSIYLGEKEFPITITGVAGIYRMGKTANHLAAQHELYTQAGTGAPVRYDPDRPFETPTQAERFVRDNISNGGSRLDLNGDQGDSKRHQFNGVPFTRDNDSRTPQEFVKAFAGYARDGNNGGSTVRTLQNIPELGGRPFEPQAVICNLTGTPNPLFGTADLTTISRNPRTNAGVVLDPLFYDTDPTTAAGPANRPRGYRATVTATTTAGTGRRPILAEEMRLWWNDDMTRRDVLPPGQERPLLDMIPQDWGTAAIEHERPRYYDSAGTLTTPTYYDVAGTPITPAFTSTGLLSFPGVSFTLPAAYTVAPATEPPVWEPRFFGTGFSPREVKGYYLEAALFGNLPVGGTRTKQQQYYANTSNTPTGIGETGIVIRERRWQQRPMLDAITGDVDDVMRASNYYWPGGWLPGATRYQDAVAGTQRPIPRPTLSNPPTQQEKLDYVQYLCSQYTVLFCGRNITAPFFGQILSATNVRDFIVTEDEFVDSRESGYMWGMYGANNDSTGNVIAGTPNAFYQHQFFPGDQPATWAGGGTVTDRDYRQNVITVHMRAFQDWLRETTMDKLGYQGSGVAANAARNHFSGVLYVHRTRRSDSMHALFTPELDWPGMSRIRNNVEDNPQRLANQTHFRAYWFNEVLDPTSLTLPAGYPPINFPWNWREPSGPLETTRCATRIKGQINDTQELNDFYADRYYRVYWNHSTPESTTDPLGTSKFTFITPQRFYLWGHFCYKVGNLTSESLGRAEIDSNLQRITPCAVFADNFTVQSVRWRDSYAQFLPVRDDGYGFPDGRAVSTSQFISMVINNSPNAAWNCGSFGSAGQEGTFRLMEDWGYDATHYWWSGSQVVMNMGRYHHSGHNFIHFARDQGRARAPAGMGIGAFHATTNHYIFNTNLFTSAGRPPLSPSGVTATRVVNQVSHFGE